MPKSKVRKKKDYTVAPATRTPGSVKTGPSSTLYVSVMLGLMLVGLLWLLVYYLAAENLPWMDALGAWNFLIGFGFMVVGLVMTMRWR
ncbi:cell division protein CrgA [Rhodococcus sp. BP-252]|uniref:cell division protein CrgA n=1 Tax=unclassified Rhodococcus (in: high G+C Gram-positive bacteria) TaxID=192944 RepID=UPI001C9B7F41|nr:MULTISPECIES: cell division protein CrgA [unclassified Rhodococcus (in: high G+C Gram-positive bacteria)]MBY6411910.1 cell division protein CrgA [Rhodococcus sp. BP-320]MBY6416462.1 cell division protein CrgA [Rhodococcus sp. BP-321]MBY6420732.1 cell division protein CrgA [Rhodococcus sp. BP-324]MBY6426486.1 cell division protein CrgA [Rhodococcus sp. BP-323]MBY6431485.1 cell division protein CrgA [Rhodococcus sp. BP-322]